MMLIRIKSCTVADHSLRSYVTVEEAQTMEYDGKRADVVALLKEFRSM